MTISNTTRICTRCGIEKDAGQYYTVKRKSGIRALRAYCKSCCNISATKWHAAHPEKSAEYVRRHRRKHYKQTSIEVGCKRYGISVSEYLEMFRSQNGKCAICEISHLELNERLSIDHCHESGKVRGLLCGRCNRMLGCAGDNKVILQKAMYYLTEREVSHLYK